MVEMWLLRAIATFIIRCRQWQQHFLKLKIAFLGFFVVHSLAFGCGIEKFFIIQRNGFIEIFVALTIYFIFHLFFLKCWNQNERIRQTKQLLNINCTLVDLSSWFDTFVILLLIVLVFKLRKKLIFFRFFISHQNVIGR